MSTTRRKFLKLLGIGGAAAITAPTVLAKTLEEPEFTVIKDKLPISGGFMGNKAWSIPRDTYKHTGTFTKLGGKNHIKPRL